MARLFSLKPLVFALGVAFGATTAFAASETEDADGAQYVPVESPQSAAAEPVRSAANTSEAVPSLGSTCLFCSTKDKEAEQETAAPAKPETAAEEPMPQDYTRITADHVEGQTDVGVRAEGDVVVERNGEVLRSEWAQYDQARDVVTAGDEFTLTRESSTVSGKHLVYDLKNQTGSGSAVRMETEHEGKRLQSVSEKAEMKGKGSYTLTNTRFNTCSPGDASWYISASEIDADQNEGIGIARNAKLVFGGLPVLYTPWADFPLNGRRKSGLLVPTVSTGSDGLELNLPYYFNLAPNRDATFRPGIISSRGVQLGGQMRYLEPEYAGTVDGDWMPHDKKRKENNRYHLKWQHSHRLSSKVSGGINYNQVSDDNYYRDFYGREDIARSVNLDRQAWLNYSDSLWGGNLDGALRVQKYQTLADQSGYKDEPYALMPRLSARWQKYAGKAQLNVFGQFTRFDHRTKQDGSRIVLYPSARWNFQNEWGYIRPKIGLHTTYYSLNSTDTQSSRNRSRVLPIVNLDGGMTFERKTSLLGKSYLQTLEPRLFYNYIPAKSQNDLPNFDTSENSFSYSQLFRENLYSGNDRINSANSLSLAVQSRILRPDNGAEMFRAGIGQKFYFRNDNVLPDGSIGRYARSRSDWVAFAHGNISSSVRTDFDIHYNQNENRAERYSAGVSYNPEPGKVLSARYKYGRNERIYLQSDGLYFYDKLSQIDLAAQWPLTKNLYAVARYNYEIKAKKPLEMLVGTEYKSHCGCWSASLVAQRYVTGENTRKTAVFFNLQLKDLSNLGSNPFEKLRLAIPGYRKTNEVVNP